jgi:hypothetical protein
MALIHSKKRDHCWFLENSSPKETREMDVDGRDLDREHALLIQKGVI